MSLWHALFGHRPELRHHGHLAGRGDYATHVEVESDYQDALEQIVGGRSEAGARFECTAFLVPESDNPDEPNAVAVHISGFRVGFLNREESEQYGAFLADADLTGVASCDALVFGGWRRHGAPGSFAVSLDLDWPLRLQEALPQD